LQTLGRKAISWAALTRYYQQVRGLLDGEPVEIDGRVCQMIQLPGHGPARPIDVPLWVAASGPKGLDAAERLDAPGIFVTSVPSGERAASKEMALLRFGTVLRPGEDHTTPRVIEAAGPGYASMVVHATWLSALDAPDALDALDAIPGGREWRAGIEAERPAAEQHLIVHQGHLTHLTDRDRDVVAAAGPAILKVGWSGDADSIAERLDEAAAEGITEIVYIPTAADVPGELAAFAAACER
jgi:5,10-methylenetetrahydromethanopterin reductase